MVAREQLVRALASEHHLDVPGGHLGEQVVGDRAADQRRLVGLGRGHHGRQHCDHVLVGVDNLVVFEAQCVRDDPCGDQFAAARHTGGEGVDSFPGLRLLGHDRRDNAGVEAAGQEHPDGHIAHHPLTHGGRQRLADGVLRDFPRRVVRTGRLRATQRVVVQVDVAPQAVLRGPEMRGWELLNIRPHVRPYVEEFPPAHFWTPQDGLRGYVDLHDDPLGGAEPAGADYPTREVAQDAVRETLATAVRERMMGDVPVGVFLSGGLDSSVIAAIMAKESQSGEAVHSFAAGMPGSSDLVAARIVADALGLEHHEVVYTDEDVVAVLPTVVAATESYEPSLIRSAVPNYLLSEMAARHVKVVLTGEGADELFAGYHHLRELDEESLRDALVDSVSALHHLNLQRCDRVTMAHGLEARVPFLSRDLLAVAQRIPI